jgi:dihydrofolate synthase/folylpolyglutamate synthase
LNGIKVSRKAFAAAGQRLLPGLKVLQQAGTPATTFEAWTVLAAEVFRQAGVDLAVVEAGMGGRLDATSAWKRVILSILTNVSLEHTRELGTSLSAICGEKIAIARKGVPLLSAEARPGLRALMRDQARGKMFPIKFAGMNSNNAIQVKAWRRTSAGLQMELIVKRRDLIKIQIPWHGEFQVLNAALAVLAIRNLQPAGYQISGKDIRQGFKSAHWPGRMEMVSQKPKIYLDGAHNPTAVHALLREWNSRSKKVYLVVGIVRDKDVSGMCREFARAAKAVWTVAPPDPRALPAKELAKHFQAWGVKAEPQAGFRPALQKAVQAAGTRGTVLVAGSLYNIAPARRALGRLKSLNLINL